MYHKREQSRTRFEFVEFIEFVGLLEFVESIELPEFLVFIEIATPRLRRDW